MDLNSQTFIEKYSSLLTFVQGSSREKITGIQTPTLARESDLIFIPDAKHLEMARHSKSRIWVVQKKLIPLAVEKLSPDIEILASPNPQLVMALIGKEFFPVTKNKMDFEGHKIHPSAVIASDAKIGKDVLIGPHVTIGARCQIEEGCIIGPNSTLEADVKLGKNCHIHPQVFIGHGTQMGAGCEVHPQSSIGTEGYGYAHDEKGNHFRITHYGNVIFEEDVHIGAGVQMDRGTFEDSYIGRGTKIDNHCHFGHNIRIGKNTLITGGMITAGSTTIGSNCVFGGRTTVTGHIEIADGCQFGGLSGVTKSVEKPGAYAGYPLQPLKQALKTAATLAQLTEMRKNLSRVLHKLGMKDEGQKD